MARYPSQRFACLIVATFAMLVPIAILHFISASFARPLDQHDTSAQADLPILKLPYGSWRAAKYDAATDVWLIVELQRSH